MENRPSWFDPQMPDRTDCVLGPLLERGMAHCPDRTFALFQDGGTWSYADVYRKAHQWAEGFRKLGVTKGDRVLAFLPNGREVILTWFAANLLGACFVPINVAYRGALLQHVIQNAGARIAVVHGKLLTRLDDIDIPSLETAIRVGRAETSPISGIVTIPSATLDNEELLAHPENDVMPWDLQSIIFTSGTTGPSKGALSSYFHLYTAAQSVFGHMTSDDRIFVNGPMFHLGGTGSVYAALIHQGSVAVVDGFSVSTFWQDLRDTGSTITSGLLGSMTVFLASHSTLDDRNNNPLRCTHFYPVTDKTIAFAEQFNFDFFSGYGSTEVPMALITDINSQIRGSCGKPRSGITCRLVDDHDCEVPVGEPGELIIRSDHPWSLTHGYNAMPDATATAWRNGWFHTGDLLTKDEEGFFYFVDRKKDAIRRRGENISSQEVESAINALPDVEDAAVIGIPGEFGEDEVMAVIEPKGGKTLEPVALFEALVPVLPHFMVPRFIRTLPELPRTPTEKVRKEALRKDGVTSDTWDREKAGIKVGREKLD